MIAGDDDSDLDLDDGDFMNNNTYVTTQSSMISIVDSKDYY